MATMSITLRISPASVTGSRSSRGLRAVCALEHGDLGRLDGVADRHPRHEAVALCLGEGVGALHLDRVLGGDDHEGLLEHVGRAVDGDLALLHGLEQRRLGLGGGAVDLVADHDVGEDAAGPELELAGVLVEDRDAGDVRGQQVGSELDPAHGAVDAARQGLAELGLADARDVLDEEMALREQHDQGGVDHVRLALMTRSMFVPDRARRPALTVSRSGRLPVCRCRHVSLIPLPRADTTVCGARNIPAGTLSVP